MDPNAGVNITALQLEAANARLEASAAKTDRMKVWEVLEMMKAKYGQLLQEKAAQTAELVQVRVRAAR